MLRITILITLLALVALTGTASAFVQVQAIVPAGELPAPAPVALIGLITLGIGLAQRRNRAS